MRSRTLAGGALGTMFVVAIALVAVTIVGCGGSGEKIGYPRNETLIIGGPLWSSPFSESASPVASEKTASGFNPYSGTYAPGLVGLVYETLFRYEPLTGKQIPWLAKSGGWTGEKTYTLIVRHGVSWSDGTAFTAADVVYNIDLGNYMTAFWNGLIKNIRSVVASGSTITVTFKNTPNYAQWQNLLWNLPMVEEAQASASIRSSADLATYSPANPIGTGPYVLDEKGGINNEHVVWTRNPGGWWAARAGIAPLPKPKYVVDLITGQDPVTALRDGTIDLLNTFVPGSPAPGDGIETYFSQPPYQLPAGTTVLVPNTTREPLADPAFRRALATAIDLRQIVATVYGSSISAADATGFPSAWTKWIDKPLLKKDGFSFNSAKARATLTAAGYEDSNGDGWLENKDGSKIQLQLVVPNERPDWLQAATMIAACAKSVQIKIVVSTMAISTFRNARDSGAFDLLLDDSVKAGSTPWTYYDYLFHLPIIVTGTGQTFANFSRFNGGPSVWSLVQQLDRTVPDDTAAMRSIISKLERISLEQLPVIPLWHEPAWAYFGTRYWKNWPSSSSNRRYYPSAAPGYLQMTGIDSIDHLQPASAAG